MDWKGVFPAITTPFDDKDRVDLDFLAEHAKWLVDNGCQGLVPLGSLGEGNTLDFEEKIQVLQMCVAAVGERAPIVAGISALSTRQAVRLAETAEQVGCRGLMVLPPYVYPGDWNEARAHFRAVVQATALPCMLYNNPISYGLDVLPEQMSELAEELPNLVAVKESSADVRRVTAIRALLKDRWAIFVGVDDAIVEGIGAGAVGWIAGLVNAFPKESVALFDLATSGQNAKARELYEWFIPLLRLDTVPKLVQLIKLAQQEVGMGAERVRAPRLELPASEREAALKVIRDALRSGPP